MFLQLSLIFCVLTIGTSGQTKKGFCKQDVKIRDIPEGAANQLINILVTGTINFFTGCQVDSVPVNSVRFYLYNRQNPKNPINLNWTNVNDVDPTKPTIVQIHGWLCSHNDGLMPMLKDAYLSRYDANIILVDWSDLSIALYTESFCKLPLAAEQVGDFMCLLETSRGVNLSTVHIVGHSMGAHLAGLLGQSVTSSCRRKIGRITGLDPTGPLYQLAHTSKRLDASDALFVDVIHTNMGFLGYYGECGTVDFYPNCGARQPGCINAVLEAASSNSSFVNLLINLPILAVSCSHVRSIEYMIESVMKPSQAFLAKRCDFCPGIPWVGVCHANFYSKDVAIMGEDCSPKTSGSKFSLVTNQKAPYAKYYL